MPKLVEALHELGLEGEIMLSGRWVKIKGTRCSAYIVELVWNEQYCTWPDDPQARTVEFYSDPIEAIEAGVRLSGYVQVGK